MFRATNALLRKQKVTTGLVGLEVQPRWREMMLKLCDDALINVTAQIPKGTLYRTVTENNFKFFQRVLKENDDYEVVEDIFNRGQVEEVIMHMEDEIVLISKMAQWKPWTIDRESVLNEKETFESGNDFSLPHDYIAPEMKYLMWDGIYKVEYTAEELAKAEEEKKAAVEAAAAAAAAAAGAKK